MPVSTSCNSKARDARQALLRTMVQLTLLPDRSKGQAMRQATYRPARKPRQETKSGALEHSPDGHFRATMQRHLEPFPPELSSLRSPRRHSRIVVEAGHVNPKREQRIDCVALTTHRRYMRGAFRYRVRQATTQAQPTSRAPTAALRREERPRCEYIGAWNSLETYRARSLARI